MKKRETNADRRVRCLWMAAVLFVLLFVLCACGDSRDTARTQSGEAEEIGETGVPTGNAVKEEAAEKEPAGQPGGYEIPPFRDAVFDSGAAEGEDGVLIDLSSTGEGYVAIYCESDSKLKFQVLKDEQTITYSVVTGKDQIFPLQLGDGHYLFRVMENIEDSKYAQLYSCEADVTIADPFDPFLRPSQYADYTEESECVKKARSFAENAGSVEEFILSVYEFVAANVTYDVEKAETVQSGYLPVPDETMETGKGICFDYASLAASMLRSNGVPTKIIFGYVAPNDIYHAWNMFYTESGGWTLVEFKVAGKEWNRVDLTFAAGGTDAKFIGDGSNYMEAYEF